MYFFVVVVNFSPWLSLGAGILREEKLGAARIDEAWNLPPVHPVFSAQLNFLFPALPSVPVPALKPPG